MKKNILIIVVVLISVTIHAKSQKAYCYWPDPVGKVIYVSDPVELSGFWDDFNEPFWKLYPNLKGRGKGIVERLVKPDYFDLNSFLEGRKKIIENYTKMGYSVKNVGVLQPIPRAKSNGSKVAGQ